VQARDPKPNRPRDPDAGFAHPVAGFGGRVAPIGRLQPGPGSAGGPPGSRTAIRTAPPPGTFPHAGPGRPGRYPFPATARGGIGLPNLRRNVCPHFYMTGSRGAIPIQAAHLLKNLIRQEQNVSRCQLRGGVHLEQGFVNDVCLTPRCNQCVFYEDGLPKD